MAFKRTWEEIVELIVGRVLTIPVARAILRRSGWRPGMGTTDDPSGGWIPPGGFKGDLLYAVWLTNDWPYLPEEKYFIWGYPFRIVFRWHTPQYQSNNYDLGEAEVTSSGGLSEEQLGTYHLYLTPSSVEHPVLPTFAMLQPLAPRLGNQSIPLLTFGARNPDYRSQETPPDFYSGFETAPDSVIQGPEDGDKSQQMLVWESVPAGTWLFPYNVEWFVTKRDLSARPGQYVPRQIKLRTCVVGNPAADLILKYSPSSPTGPWTDLISLNLQPGGPRSTGWVAFPEGAAAADVWVAFFIRARSSLGQLHIGPIESLMRWAPRATQLPLDLL